MSFTIRGILPLVELLFVGPYLYIRPVWFLVQAIPMPMENGIQFLIYKENLYINIINPNNYTILFSKVVFYKPDRGGLD